MSQSLENRQNDERAKLDLQINLLAEREATKILELLRAICKKHGMPEAEDPELLDLLRPTEADHVLNELEKQRPDQGTEPEAQPASENKGGQPGLLSKA